MNLIKAGIEDSKEIHKMQIEGFRALLEKYNDHDTNPGAETLDIVKRRFSFDSVDHYFISLDGKKIGYIRIHRLDNVTNRLSQMFILPSFQNKGYAQEAIKKVESFYSDSEKWELDTIKQEEKLCHLYEKMGYRLTGVEKNIKDGMDLVFYEK